MQSHMAGCRVDGVPIQIYDKKRTHNSGWDNQCWDWSSYGRRERWTWGWDDDHRAEPRKGASASLALEDYRRESSSEKDQRDNQSQELAISTRMEASQSPRDKKVEQVAPDAPEVDFDGSTPESKKARGKRASSEDIEEAAYQALLKRPVMKRPAASTSVKSETHAKKKPRVKAVKSATHAKKEPSPKAVKSATHAKKKASVKAEVKKESASAKVPKPSAKAKLEVGESVGKVIKIDYVVKWSPSEGDGDRSKNAFMSLHYTRAKPLLHRASDADRKATLSSITRKASDAWIKHMS